ncbi:hypothetical protein BCR32DRAFT_268320 [Anaeromyces robustus]|uniref:Uncharacterized protein n=1 Tax=Anaeromyces robustus TaxID=1754192 RepID=A0A1Y1X6G0_9FUNG|nr:hypothetical protein BCR32DRAFT_268320 [Anaeromyces robustus]|eukprot:ORX81379.1 hypothetical protein BCR32DRAFT_268320 [Anaeromyces robustus]
METSNEANAVSILSWIFDELDTQKFGLNNNKHFNYFDDSEENIQKINHFYLSIRPFTSDLDLSNKGNGDEDGMIISSGRQNNGNNKNRPNQGEAGDLKYLRQHKEDPEKEINNTVNQSKDSSIIINNDKEKDFELGSKNLNFDCFNANISLNPEENHKYILSKELRKYKSEYRLKDLNNSSSKKLPRSLSTSVLIPPFSVPFNVKFSKITKETNNSIFNSSNRSLFNSNILSDEPENFPDKLFDKINKDFLTEEFPDNKLEKNDIDPDTVEENYDDSKDELINNNKITNSIKNTDLILEKIMDNPTDHSIKKDGNNKSTTNTKIDASSSSLSETTSSSSTLNANAKSTVNSKENIIKLSLESVMTQRNLKMSQDDLSLLDKENIKRYAYTLNEYGQSLFRLRYYLLQLKYLIDCNKDIEQIIFYKLALSQYPDSNSVRTWLKRRITREPLVHGYCLPPFSTNDDNSLVNNDIFSRPLKNKIFHSLSLDKKYQVIEPLSFEFDRKVMGTSEHKSLVSCNSNLKYCQMKQRSDIVLRTIFIKRLFQQAPEVKRLIGNERFQTLKDKALLNLQPRMSKHYKSEKTVSNSMISIKLKTNKKKGIYLQHHSKKSSYDFSGRNVRTLNNTLLPPQPVDTINSNMNGNNGKGLHSSTFNKRFEKSKSFQNVFSSNSPSKLRNCHIKHSHISSISSINGIKDVNTNNNNCYNLSNLKNTIENVSRAKINNNNIVRNINTVPINLNNDGSQVIHINNYDANNSNRVLKDIHSQKSLSSFKDLNNEEDDNIQQNFNQSDVINNYSDQDSVYSLSSMYDFNKDNNSNEKDQKSNEEDDNILNSNRTLVIYQDTKRKKESVFKKIYVLMKPKKQNDKSEKMSKHSSKDSKSKNKNKNNDIRCSSNIVDSEETINNSMEISNPNSNTLSYSNFSINNSNSSMNSNYYSNETINSNSRSINNINKNVVIVKTADNTKTKKSTKKWRINLFNKHQRNKIQS